MTYSVVLPYREDERAFYVHLEGGPGRPYVHEFRPTAEMNKWLIGRSLVSYRTMVRGIPPMEIFSHMEFTFQDPEDAMLFKLTWL